MTKAHEPVLLQEFLEFFSEKKIRFFVDGTVGAGGHSRALLEAHPEIERFIGLDRDPAALELAQENLKPWKEKLTLVHSNFRYLKEAVPLESVDGIFFDLGLSSMQLADSGRGFSFYHEGPLDMRMDPTAQLDAATLVNTFSQRELEKIFREYGEESRYRAAAKAIVEGRRKKQIVTTKDLTELLSKSFPWRRKKFHPLTLIFQALRIYVNDELISIEEALPQAVDLLKKGGRLGVISFHSLEDRIVKQSFRSFSQEKRVQILTKKPLIASREEVRNNPRSRSAKLRFLEKL